jgi:hypothetical protein
MYKRFGELRDSGALSTDYTLLGRPDFIAGVPRPAPRQVGDFTLKKPHPCGKFPRRAAARHRPIVVHLNLDSLALRRLRMIC